jgi:acetyl-CoA carboxylase beta subunit
LFVSITPSDPLSFVDGKGAYPAKVDEARAKTQLNESVVTGAGTINGIPVSIAVMDFRFLGGSLGSGTGEKILWEGRRVTLRCPGVGGVLFVVSLCFLCFT